jgi:hypothetical protein
MIQVNFNLIFYSMNKEVCNEIININGLLSIISSMCDTKLNCTEFTEYAAYAAAGGSGEVTKSPRILI